MEHNIVDGIGGYNFERRGHGMEGEGREGREEGRKEY